MVVPYLYIRLYDTINILILRILPNSDAAGGKKQQDCSA